MANGKRRSRAGGVLITLLVLLAVLVAAFHGQGPALRAARTAPLPVSSSTSLPEEVHQHAPSQAGSLATRIRQELTPAPGHIPVAMLLSTLLGAAILAFLAARGPIFTRGPDNPGRYRLITIGIDRR